MCQRITCSSCGKPSFAGCGRHVEAVLGDVPPAERCHCRERAEEPGARKAAPEKNWFRSFFGSGGGKVP